MGRTSDARERLIKSARELIYARGYNSVGVKEICQDAGVNKGSFYHFYASKRDLVLDVIRAEDAAYRRLADKVIGSDAPPLQKIERLFELTYERHRSVAKATGEVKGCPIGNLALELSAQDEAVRRELQSKFEGWAGYFELAIREAIERGDIPHTDATTAARALVAYNEGIVMLAKVNNDPAVVKDLAAGAIRLAAFSSPAEAH